MIATSCFLMPLHTALLRYGAMLMLLYAEALRAAFSRRYAVEQQILRGAP